jgi:hypothetical protein
MGKWGEIRGDRTLRNKAESEISTHEKTSVPSMKKPHPVKRGRPSGELATEGLFL